MPGDFSRDSHDRAKTFSLVRMQQGRLFSDADWNEQGDILRDSDRAGLRDVIGPYGFPEDDPGFALSFDAQTGALLIGAGSGYVAGVRHAAAPPTPMRVARVSGSGAGALWRIDEGGPLGDGDVLISGADLHLVRDYEETAEGVRRFRTTPALSTPDGQVAVALTVTRQPHGAQQALPTAAGTYLAYLASSDREVTALEDPDLREVAFGGPDTATRDQAVWQVGLVPVSLLSQRGFGSGDLTCPALARGFDPVLGPNRSAGRMRARAEVSAAEPTPCTLPPGAGYRSLDNQLYRVEIHRGGGADRAQYKWSRENAIHRTLYREIDAGVLIVDSVGRDEPGALKATDWIEIRDAETRQADAPGFFAQIGEVIGTRLSLAEIRDPVTLAPLTDAGGLPDTDRLPPAATVTRWEGGPPRPVSEALDDWGDLEHGVQLRFDDGRFQEGDYWTIPARAATGDVDWPRDPISDAPLSRPPAGPRRDYAALAMLRRDGAGAWSVLEDCRPLFPALTRAKRLHYAGGDGQETQPDPLAPDKRVALPAPLQVSVQRGEAPVEGDAVEFRVTSGDGRLGNGQSRETVLTGPDGVAQVRWLLDGRMAAQRVEARRLDAAGDPTHAPVTFNATLSRADLMSFDPDGIAPLAGANTVQRAIEVLAGMQQIGCATHVITPDQDWVAVLEGLAPGSNAAICFAAGTYTATRAVQLSKLGHISLHGAGAGASILSVDRSETALQFTACASVHVSGLSLATPAGNSGITGTAADGRKGTLDLSHCAQVDIRDCAISCGGGTSPRRSCVTVRGWSQTLSRLIATAQVRICDNSFTVGHMQEAVLVTDAIDVDISGNRIGVRPRKPGTLGTDQFLADPIWTSGVATGLIARPAKGKTLSSTAQKEIRFEQWRMAFHSPIDQPAWDDLVAANPPKPADLKSAETFTRYGQKLIDTAAAEPAQFPAFDKQLERTRKSLGQDAGRMDEPKVVRTLLVTSEPQSYRFDAGPTGQARQVLLEANGEVVAFDSPIDQRDWNRALARRDEAAKVANADQLLGLAEQMARDFVVNPGARAGLGSAENWFKGLVEDSPTLAAQGIICAGRQLGNLRIHGNIIRDCQVGLRVAPSHRQDQRHDAASVAVTDNRMELMAPHAEAYAGYGMFIGNARTVRITGNDMKLSPRPNFTRYFAQGIRLWGFVGRQVLVSGNRIAMATMGVRLHHVERDVSGDVLWVIDRNLIEGPKGTRAHKITPSGVAVLEHNAVLPVV